MQISGIQKTTLVDFPGLVAATIFTRGCTFRCPFCHNPELVLPKHFLPLIPKEIVWHFLESRRGKLQGICLTGGEPLMQPDLIDFIKRIRSLGFKIKLDTNGSLSDNLARITSGKLVDYIAMDVKSPIKRYGLACGVPNFQTNQIKQSIKMIMNSGIPYEFRTTVVHPLHQPSDFKQIGQLIFGADLYFIQNFVQSKHIDETTQFRPFSKEELEKAKEKIKKYVKKVEIRN